MSTTSLPVRPPPASASGARPVITSDFWDLYKSSKRDTGYVLDWLRRTVENAARTKKSKTPIVPIDGRLTVQNLLQASEFVSKRQVTAPLYIRGAFKRTLVKRRQITEWYRQRERIDPTVKPGNESHAFFNDALATAYDLMFPDQDEPAPEKPAAAKDTSKPAGDDSPKASKNFFDVLANIPEEEPGSPVLELAERDVPEDVPEPIEYVFVDDPLAEILDLHLYVLEMDALVSATKHFWKLSANAEMPVPLAAWLTTAGFAATKRLCDLVTPAIGGHRALLHHYTSKRADLGISGIDVSQGMVEKTGQSPIYKEFSDGLALAFPCSALVNFKKDKQNDSEFMGVIERQPISKSFLSEEKEKEEQEKFMQAVMKTISDPSKKELSADEALAVMQLLAERQSRDSQAMESVLRSITQLIKDDKNKGASWKDDMNPLLPETREFLGSKELYPGTTLVVGLQLLLETSKSFVYKGDAPNPMNCRMMALRLAQEVVQNIQFVNDHDLVAKNHTVPMASGLHGVSDRLKALMREKRLDLYSQSPWTGGQQMVQTLAYALEAGLSLCNQRGIVGTVLYGYNAVQQLSDAPVKNPLLDALSNLLLDAVFLGRLPASNMHSIWMRFLGGGVEKKSARGKDGKKFSITFPKRPTDSNNTADFQKRIDAFSLSLFHNLYESYWMGRPEFWAQVFSNREKKTVSKAESIQLDIKLHRRPFGEALYMMSDVVSSEFNSEFPVAKVNFFAVYTTCVDMLTEISRRATANPPEELRWAWDLGVIDSHVDAAAGFTFMNHLLQDIDVRSSKGDKANISKHSGLRLVQDAINHVWGDKKWEDFFWKSV
ncbi:NADP-dependent leukotriene b4 12-hydroxydehydrogenase [Lasiodiplodia theobromae]|uniref:NADP-dependent leukotriene b4 12-hydroxydehydrogenase n=1 Tax=Lasiodiplodia theobromae TaxID=45133 RepID=UPI0015C3C71A|nr:NADP-dependent leukotriene b4 12-hydroxydehydrogenase [Lasiodiplodia theobromae]KAF4537495.1 NADP-dependent leukotriene b4 12-hydroxydehydrogenase [Lasiodiplodia theobromae]